MAIPIVTASPDSTTDVNLPIASNISGTNIFERDDFTGSESYTQSGGDAPASSYKGGTSIVEGTINDAMVLDGIDGYLDLNDRIPSVTTFFGYSTLIKIISLSGEPRIVYLSDAGSIAKPMDLFINVRAKGHGPIFMD